MDDYAANVEDIKKRATDWNRANKSRRSQINKKSNEKYATEIAKKRRAKRATDEERKRRNEYSRQWRKANPEKRLEKERRYRSRHPEKMAIRWAVKNARRKGAPGKYRKADIDAIRVKQRGKCAYCKISLSKVQEHRDHIIPICLGGTNNPSNMQLLCERCNLKKGMQHPIVFAQARGLLL